MEMVILLAVAGLVGGGLLLAIIVVVVLVVLGGKKQWVEPAPAVAVRSGTGGPLGPPCHFELPLPERPSEAGMQTVGRLWHRRDGVWQLVTGRDDDPIKALWGTSANEVYAVGWDNFHVRRYNGVSWTPERGKARRYGGVFGDGRGGVWTVGGGCVHERRPDGSWDEVSPRLESGQGGLGAVGGLPDLVFAVGSPGRIYRRSPDGSWHHQPPPCDDFLIAVAGFSPDAMWVVGQQGGIYRLRGESWVEEHRVDATLGAAWAESRGIYVVGSGGLILFSSGDGQWHRQDSTTECQLTDVWGRSTTEIYATGLQGTILQSAGDGTWRAITSNFRHQFGAVWGPRDSDELLLVGERFYVE